MPKLHGFFDDYPELQSLPGDKIKVWYDTNEDIKLLENKLANRLLYSSAVASTQQEMLFSKALLREAIKLHPDKYLNQTHTKLYIPQEFLTVVPEHKGLIEVFIDALELAGIVSVFLNPEDIGIKSLGTYIRPELKSPNGTIYIWVGGRMNELKVGDFRIIPTDSHKVDIKFQSEAAWLLNKDNLATEVTGGELGIVVDLRTKFSKFMEKKSRFLGI